MNSATSGALARHVEDYLRLRRSLGFKLHREGVILPRFAAYLQSAGASTVTTELAVAWACQPVGVHPVSWHHRLGAVRGFAVYLRTIDPATEIPSPDVFPGQGKRPEPHIYSDHEIAGLLQATPVTAAGAARRHLPDSARAGGGRRPANQRGVAADARQRRLGRRDAHRHQRQVRLSQTASLAPHHHRGAALLCRSPRPATAGSADERVLPVLRGTALCYALVRATFIQLTTAIGLRTESTKPRIHDLRHTFAVRTLLRWYQGQHDVAGNLATLSAYLGHINPAGTYWYLSATPELLQLAAQRLDTRGE